MSRPSSPSLQPAPPPPPTDLADVDAQLKALGYEEGKAYRTIPGQTTQSMGTGRFDRGGELMQSVATTGMIDNPNAAKIDALLGYQKKFLEAENKIRTSTPMGRRANIFTTQRGLLSEPNAASRALLGV